MSTIIIVIISVAVLILGLILVKNIMCKAIGGIENIDDQLREELGKIVNDGKTVAVKEVSNNIPKGILYGVSFVINNDKSTQGKFSYSVTASDLGQCSFSKEAAGSFIVIGEHDENIAINPGDNYVGLIRLKIPKSTENCQLRYTVNVMESNTQYSSAYFDVTIENGKAIC